MPSSLTEIEKDAFYGCTSLTIIELPSSLKTIGENAFGDCKSLTEVTIPSSMQLIAHNAFNGCTSLEKSVIDRIKEFIEMPVTNIYVIGDELVGKTSFVDSYTNCKFGVKLVESSIPDVRYKEVKFEGYKIKVKIWKSNKNQLNIYSPGYYRGLQSIILIFDFSNRSSFNASRYFLDNFYDKNKDNKKRPLVVLVGNKCDLEHAVIEEEIEDIIILYKEYNLKYFEVSVKENLNINNVFDYIVKEINLPIIEKTNLMLNILGNNKSDNQKKCNIY